MTKSRILFWTRLISWLSIGCGIPIGVFAHKFGLFTKHVVEYDELGNIVSQPDISLNGWGIISILLIGSFISTIVKEIADSYTGYSLVKQCYIGFCKTMPFIIAFAILYFLKNIIEQTMFCLGIIVVCRLVSIPLNPLPKWRCEKQGVEDYSTLSENLTKIVKTCMKRGDLV